MDWAGIDEWIYRRLTELVDVLPMRFVKLVAHNYTDARVRKLYWRRLGLEMGEGTYANLGLTLLSDDYTPRVHIGRGAVIGAGSVVTGDVEAYHIYAGVPARKIRDIRTGERVQ